MPTSSVPTLPPSDIEIPAFNTCRTGECSHQNRRGAHRFSSSRHLTWLRFAFLIAILTYSSYTLLAASPFVQATAGAAPASGNSLSVSFPANTVAGDLILVGIGFASNATASSVTDSQGNTFTQVGTQLTSPVGTRSVVYYAKKIKGGADSVTVNLSASSGIELYLTEYSGIDQTNPIDGQAGSSGGAGTVSSGNATTTNAGDVIYGFCEADWACTAGSGFAVRSAYVDNLIEDRTSGSAGIYAATGSATKGWTMQMVALKPASAPVITSATTANGSAGNTFSFQIAATNSPTSFGAAGLPAGLTVKSGTGLISGKPRAAGTSTVTLSATNSNGTATAKLTLTVTLPSPVITSAATASGTVGIAFSYQIEAWSWPTSYGATGLPPGLTVTLGGLISGKPTVAGTSTITLYATNGSGNGTAKLTLAIAAAAPTLSIATTTVAFGDVALNSPATQTVTLTSTGASPVTVSSLTVTIGIGFKVSGPTLPITLSTGQQATLEVEFDPAVTGGATGLTTIVSTSSTNGVAVISLTGTGVSSSNAVDLSWDAPSSPSDPVEGYKIFRSLSGTSTYELLNVLVDGETAYTDPTVQAGQTYDYIIESVDASGNASAPSVPIAVTIP
jgi:hypothetical protein